MFHLHGHELAVRQLEHALRDGRLHHAYLFTGPEHVGKTTLAVQLAQAVNCEGDGPPCGVCSACTRIAAGQHADVRFLGVGGGGEGPSTVIGIDAVRDLISTAHLRPYEGRQHVFIIQNAARLGNDAANALLKVLEEPPPDTLLVLLTDAPEGLPPTVRSRCLQVELRALPLEQVTGLLRENYDAGEDQADAISRLSRGCIGWAIEAARSPALLTAVHQRIEKIADIAEAGLEVRFAYADELARKYQRDRATGREELFLWQRWLRDILLVQQGHGEEIVHLSWRETLERQAAALTPAETVRWAHRLSETVEALDRNANGRLALEVLMLDTPEITGAAL